MWRFNSHLRKAKNIYFMQPFQTESGRSSRSDSFYVEPRCPRLYWHLFCATLSRRSKVCFASPISQKVTLGSPVRLWRLFKSPTPITTAHCRCQLLASSKVQFPPPKCLKYLFYMSITDKKHNIVELNSCVVLFVFNIIYVIKGG